MVQRMLAGKPSRGKKLLRCGDARKRTCILGSTAHTLPLPSASIEAPTRLVLASAFVMSFCSRACPRRVRWDNPLEWQLCLPKCVRRGGRGGMLCASV